MSQLIFGFIFQKSPKIHKLTLSPSFSFLFAIYEIRMQQPNVTPCILNHYRNFYHQDINIYIFMEVYSNIYILLLKFKNVSTVRLFAFFSSSLKLTNELFHIGRMYCNIKIVVLANILFHFGKVMCKFRICMIFKNYHHTLNIRIHYSFIYIKICRRNSYFKNKINEKNVAFKKRDDKKNKICEISLNLVPFAFYVPNLQQTPQGLFENIKFKAGIFLIQLLYLYSFQYKRQMVAD